MKHLYSRYEEIPTNTTTAQKWGWVHYYMTEHGLLRLIETW